MVSSFKWIVYRTYMYSKMVSGSFRHFDELYFSYIKSIIDGVVIRQVLKPSNLIIKKSCVVLI